MHGPTVWLAGAAPDTANLGVTALGHAVLHGLALRVPDVRFVQLDHGHGRDRSDTVTIGGRALRVERRGASRTRRIHRAESLWSMRLDARLGLGLNRNVRGLRRAAALLDLSGGDSFTDLYGPARFDAIATIKEIALASGTPLVLLPQTYGPFRDDTNARRAARIVQRAAAAWARDERSFEVLRELAGPRPPADPRSPDRPRIGRSVDVAFSLPAQRPIEHLSDELLGWIDEPGSFVGLNVSGLIANDPERARTGFGFRADYGEVVVRLARHIASRGRLLLVPHVVTPPGHYESDLEACERVRAALPRDAEVLVAPALADPGGIKAIIGASSWFCGTRMHSTIAALSSGVPTAAIAYSPKTLGVFETCGVGREVVDPRRLGTDAVVDALVAGYDRRDTVRRLLLKSLPEVMESADATMDHVAQLVRAHAGRPGTGRG